MDIDLKLILDIVEKLGIAGLFGLYLYLGHKRSVKKDELDARYKADRNVIDKEANRIQGNHMKHVEAVMEQNVAVGKEQVRATKELTETIRFCPINEKNRR